MSLSDKIEKHIISRVILNQGGAGGSTENFILYADDVRKAVRELNRKLCECGATVRCQNCKIIEEIFGEKLI